MEQESNFNTSAASPQLAAAGSPDQLELMQQHQEHTALTFLPVLPLPEEIISNEVAEAHLEQLRSLSTDIGPAVLVQAVQNVVSEDL